MIEKNGTPIVEVVFRDGSGEPGPKVQTPEQAFEQVKHIGKNTQEELWTVLLDPQSRTIGRQMVARGTSIKVGTPLCEIFRGVLASGAAGFYLAHNHPSGTAEPSDADIEMTLMVVRVGHVLNLPLQDHIIVGEKGTFCSIREGLNSGKFKVPAKEPTIEEIMPLPDLPEYLKKALSKRR